MPLTNDKKAQYEAVKHDLEEERRQKLEQIASLNADVRDLNASINTLSKRIDPDATEPYPSTTPIRPALKYANLSVRWAILDLLHGSTPKATGEIAEALKAGGIPTNAANFANNVSAVLTTTMKENGEVTQVADKWELTDRGKEKIEHIKTTSKYRRGLSSRDRFQDSRVGGYMKIIS